MKQISILGCGWLGLPLAQRLIESGFAVKGSTTSTDKIAVLQNMGIDPYVISVSENDITGEIYNFLRESEILIIDIPPRLRGSEKENFVSKIRNIFPFIVNTGLKKVLFISSTAVYADDNSVVTEDTEPEPETEAGRQLLEAEIFLKNNPHFHTTVLRFGGLIGADRHPIYFLAGRQHLENPDGSINLIHQQDCINIIQRIIEKEVWNETLNAVAPFHPTREDYYTKKAEALSLPKPRFAALSSYGKTINSAKLMDVLDYKFIGDY